MTTEGWKTSREADDGFGKAIVVVSQTLNLHMSVWFVNWSKTIHRLYVTQYKLKYD